MIDASVDADFASLERKDSQKPSAPVRWRAPATLATLPAAPSPRPGELAAEGVAEVAVPPPPSDPLGHLRTARLGFAAAVVLVLYWLWLRERRKS